MPSLKEYNVKLARLRTTRKMTKTMKLVSVNKLRRAQEAEKRAKIFSDRLFRMVARLTTTGAGHDNALLTARRKKADILVMVFTSDRGLCGGFNHGVNRTVARWIEQQKGEGRSVEICCSGRRGYSFFRSRSTIRRFYEDAATRPAYDIACRIGHDLRSDFLRGIADEVYLAHNKPHGPGSQTPVIERLLPLDTATLDALAREEGAATGDCLFEPAPAELLGALVPQMINLKVYSVMLSSASGEHGARMRAMDQATSNADSLIEKLTLRRNRARQAQITTELTEIVAGAEALK